MTQRLQGPVRRSATAYIDSRVSSVLPGPLSEEAYLVWDATEDRITPPALRHYRGWLRHWQRAFPRQHRAYQAACRLCARLGLPRPREFGRYLPAPDAKRVGLIDWLSSLPPHLYGQRLPEWLLTGDIGEAA